MEILFGAGPKVEPVIKSEVWRLTDDFKCIVNGAEIIVPEGFITDGASIPRMLWWLCGHPMTTKRLPIAVLHDFLYSSPGSLTREQVDEIYRDGLVALGFPRCQANIEHLMIRIFGGSHWEGD